MLVLRHRWADRLAALVDRHPEPSHVDKEKGRLVAMRDDVTSLQVGHGTITGVVTLERRPPATVTITVPVIPMDVWPDLLDALGASLRPVATLLAGDLPDELERFTASRELELFPNEIEVHTTDGVSPWRSISAAWYAFVRRCDADPFTLLELHGRSRAHVLAELRNRRSGNRDAALTIPTADGVEVVEGLRATGMWDAGPGLGAVEVHPHPPEDPTVMLRHLGDPPGMRDERGLEEILWRAAETAWTLAADEGSDEADEELLLAELRARGMATAQQLADATGWDPARATEVLDRLYGEGTIMRGGSGGNARYRA